MPSRRSPAWTRDEVILALELYIRKQRRVPDDTDPDVIQLSVDLNRLPIIPPDQRAPSFRNPAGVALKIANLRSFDPTTTSKGMSAGSRLDGQIYAEFGDHPAALSAAARAIRAHYRAWLQPTVPEPLIRYPVDAPQAPLRHVAESASVRETQFDPFALHLLLENDMDARKHWQSGNQTTPCAICGFDFGRTYGELGAGYIQFHHRVPLTELAAGHKPTATDLVPICANCHAMLHQPEATLTIDELRTAIRDTQKAALRQLATRLRPPDE